MPRRGRRATHKHVALGKSVRPMGESGFVADTACGESFAFPKGATAEAIAEHNREANCPACSRKWGKAKLARAMGRVRLEPWTPSAEELEARNRTPEFKPYRSAWRVYVDGVERAAIVNDFGFGTDWEIRELKAFEPRGYTWHGRQVGAAPSGYWNESSESDGVFAIHRASRDAAAFACIDLAERGLLPTLAEQAELDRLAKIAAAEREAERQRERAERDRLAEEREAERQRLAAERTERIATARLGLAELQQRGDLSNLESAGLAAMAALLESMK